MGAPSPDTQIANIRNERLAESRRASTDAVLRRLGQKTLGATTNIATSSNTDILDIGLARSKQEKKEELEIKKKEDVQSNLEKKGKNKADVDEIKDEKKKEKRNQIREVSDKIGENIRAKETESSEDKKELKNKKSESDIKLSDAETNVSLFFDINQAKANGAIKADGSIDITIVKAHPLGGNLPPNRANAADAALMEWNKISKENKALETKINTSSSLKIDIQSEVDSELKGFVDTLYAEGTNIGEIKALLDEEIVRLAIVEMKKEGGKFKRKDFVKKYFLQENPPGSGNFEVIDTLKSRYTITDLEDVTKTISGNSKSAVYKRSMIELTDAIDRGEDAIQTVENLLKINKIALTSKEAKKLKDIAQRVYLSSDDLRETGDLSQIINLNISQKDKVYYVEAYAKFNQDTFLKDFKDISSLESTINNPTLKRRIQKIMDQMKNDMAAETADPNGTIGIDDFNANIDSAVKKGEISSVEADQLKKDVMALRQNKIFLLYMDKLSDDFIAGKFTWEQLGISNNLTGTYKKDGLLGQLVAKKEISDEQAKAIAKYLGKGNQSAKDFVQADFALFNDYMDDVRDNAIHNIENNPMISDALKNAEIARIEALSRLNDIQNDKLKNIFDVAERAWYSNSYTFKKYARYIQWFALIAGGGAIGLSTGRPELMILFAIAGGVGGAEGFRRMSKSMEKSANIALLFSEQQVSRQRADDETRLMAYIFSEIQTNDMDPVNARIFLRAMGMDPAMLDSMTDGESVMQMQADRIAQARESIIEIRTKIKNLKAA